MRDLITHRTFSSHGFELVFQGLLTYYLSVLVLTSYSTLLSDYSNDSFVPLPIKCEVASSPPLYDEGGGTDENLAQDPLHDQPVEDPFEKKFYRGRSADLLSPNRQSPPAVDLTPWVPTRKCRVKQSLRRLLPAPAARGDLQKARTSRKLAKDVATFRCSSCNFVTTNKMILNYHVNQTHVAASVGVVGKPYSCQYCRYRCKSPSVLTVHVDSVHYTDTLIDKIANK